MNKDIHAGESEKKIEVNNEYCKNQSWPTDEQVMQFQSDGYVVFHQVLSQETVHQLNHRLELVLRGEYNTGCGPDKTPKLIKTPYANENLSDCDVRKKKALGYSGNKRKKVFQIINIHKSDKLFRELVTIPLLGRLVSKLMKWEDGARLCQDQVWAKPPGAPPLAYHRDSPYFMFSPDPVATVWIALDDMEPELGPLTYVKASHKWGDGRVGSSQNFFQDNGGMALLYSAAEREGIDIKSLEYESMNGLLAGGISIHDGRTWHGSGSNSSNLPRRGIGLHFIPVKCRWTELAMKSQLWRKYVESEIECGGNVAEIELDDHDFPVTWTPSKDAC